MKMVEVDKAGEPLRKELDRLTTMREQAFAQEKPITPDMLGLKQIGGGTIRSTTPLYRIYPPR